MGERNINPLLNIQADKKYKEMIFINPYRFGFSDPGSNVFLGSVNNLWSNAANWSYGHVPTSSEKARIHNNIVLDITTTVGELLVDAGYTLSGSTTARILTVNGNCISNGIINLSNAAHALSLKGTTNSLVKANFSVTTVIYAASGNQDVLDLNYTNLECTGAGYKSATSNIITSGSLRCVSGMLSMTIYDLFVGGITTLSGYYGLTKSGAGNIVFVGHVTGGFNLSGNPDVECRGGITQGFSNYSVEGTGNWRFTTNSQLFRVEWRDLFTIAGNLTIEGDITLTIEDSSLFGYGYECGIRVNGIINGTTAGSTLRNKGQLGLGNPTIPMQTGVYDYMVGSDALIEIFYNGNYQLHKTLYRHLRIGRGVTGTKTVSGDLVINGNLETRSRLDLENNNLTVNGWTLSTEGAFLLKSGTGNMLFVGNIRAFFNFSGNPDVECRGGMGILDFSNLSPITGNGLWKFTTNNQSISCEERNAFTFAGNVLISGAITVTHIFYAYPDYSNSGATFNGTINGDNAASKFVNNAKVNYKNAQAPMQIGILDCNAAANTFEYGSNGNQDIKLGTYRNLKLSTGGAKKLLGSVSVVNTYTLTSPATLDSNGYALTNP